MHARKLICAAVIAAAAAVHAAPAPAGDAAARRVIGFSPDGTVFVFEQSTMIYEDDAAFSEYVAIDTRTDKYLPGTPVRVLLRGDDGLDAGKAQEQAARKAEPILKKYKVGDNGTHIAGKPSMDLDDGGIYQMGAEPMSKTLDFTLPDGRKARLAVADRPLGSAVCEGYGGRGMKGKAEVAGLKLTLQIAGAPAVVMQEDKALPASRKCAAEYGIAEAWLHKAADGTVTLAAMIEYADNHDYHAGPNRRFMAVTKRLAR